MARQKPQGRGRGKRVDAAKEQEFRLKLLELGVVTHAADAVKLPWSTAADLAKRAEADPAFVTAREAVRARFLPELEARLCRMADKVQARIEAEDPTPDELAKIAVSNGLKSFSWHNPKPNYLRALVGLHTSLANARRPAAEPQVVQVAAGAGDVQVTVSPTLHAAQRLAQTG